MSLDRACASYVAINGRHPMAEHDDAYSHGHLLEGPSAPPDQRGVVAEEWEGYLPAQCGCLWSVTPCAGSTS